MNKNLTSREFYDEISNDYNSLMETVSSNAVVRTKVAKFVSETVQGKVIMDFGGGTGADLPWLTRTSRRIYFFEPSEGMRLKAMEWTNQSAGTENVRFINRGLDFNRWEINDLPVDEKMDVILANFAVVNCISSIETLFQKLSMVTKPNGYLFCTVIDTRLIKRITKYPIRTLTSFISGRTMQTTNRYKNMSHTVYLYTLNEIKQHSLLHFSIEEIIKLDGYGFLLLRMKRTI